MSCLLAPIYIHTLEIVRVTHFRGRRLPRPHGGSLSHAPLQIYELVYSTSTLQKSLAFPEDSHRDHNYLGSKLPLFSFKQMNSISTL